MKKFGSVQGAKQTMKMLSGKSQVNRRINASLVFGLLQRGGPLSRPELAQKTNLRLPSISEIVQQLIDEGYVHEVGRGKSTGGRYPRLLALSPDGMFSAGIEVAENKLRGVIVDLTGKTRVMRERTLADTEVDTVLDGCEQLLAKLTENFDISLDQLSGVGITVPGIVSKKDDTVVLSTALNWKNIPLQTLLHKRLSKRVYLLNNALAGALAEYFDMPSPRFNNLMYVLVYLSQMEQPELATMGFGIIIDGHPYFGEGHIAGEVRKELKHPAWRISGQAGKSVSAKTFIQQCRKQPASHLAVWEDFAEDLGQIVASGVDFLNPGQLIVACDVPEFAEWGGDALRNALQQHTVLGKLAENPERKLKSFVRFETIESGTVARGAIIPFLNELSLSSHHLRKLGL